MGNLAWTVATAALVLGALACSSEGEDEETRRRGATESEELTGPRPDALYDDDGNLLESDVVVAGLRLPRGLEEKLVEERSHTYESRVPIEKIIAYFGPRLMTGAIDRMGSGAVFRAAEPSGARGGVVKLDVSILPMGTSRTRVAIFELPPVPENPPPEAESIRQMDEQLRQLD